MAKAKFKTIPGLTDDELRRFWALVGPPTSITGVDLSLTKPCRLWRGPRTHPEPYTGPGPNHGVFYVGGDTSADVYSVHRVAYVLGGGIITAAKPYVLRWCGQFLCCEFTHLFTGSMLDKVHQDRIFGRHLTEYRDGVLTFIACGHPVDGNSSMVDGRCLVCKRVYALHCRARQYKLSEIRDQVAACHAADLYPAVDINLLEWLDAHPPVRLPSARAVRDDSSPKPLYW